MKKKKMEIYEYPAEKFHINVTSISVIDLNSTVARIVDIKMISTENRYLFHSHVHWSHRDSNDRDGIRNSTKQYY